MEENFRSAITLEDIASPAAMNSLPAVETFLEASMNSQLFATTKIAYQPGITR